MRSKLLDAFEQLYVYGLDTNVLRRLCMWILIEAAFLSLPFNPSRSIFVHKTDKYI